LLGALAVADLLYSWLMKWGSSEITLRLCKVKV
jgi:hypothetical protein